VVVLGIGNVLLSDEGVGVHVIKALAQRYEETNEVEFVDGGTAGMELLPLIEGADHLIVIDAIRCGQPPASIVRIEGEQVPAYFKTKLSPHQVGLSDLLAVLNFKGTVPGRVVLIGVQPVKLSLGLVPSPEVKTRLQEVVSMVVAELEAIGRPALLPRGALGRGVQRSEAEDEPSRPAGHHRS
jgi:hydrogenase maturation protease